MPYSKNSDHVAQGLANLIEQFKGKVVVEQLLSIYLGQIQEMEDALSDLLTETAPGVATGVHQDNNGAIVGEPRAGRDDPAYQIAFDARVLLNKSGGTIEEVIELALAVSGAPVNIEIEEVFPAGFVAHIVDPIDPLLVDTEAMAGYIDSGRPSGVRGQLAFAIASAFQYDGPAGTGFDEGPYGTALEA